MNSYSAALRLTLFCWALTSFSTASLAGEPSATPDAQQEAVDLFRQSVEHYRAGRFQQAIDLLTRAYALEPEPVLLYNLARAHEGLGENSEAIDAYERYLRETAESKDRGAIEKRIETLRRQVAERRRLQEEERRAERERRKLLERDREEAKLPPEPTGTMSAAPWIVASVGGVLLGNGAVFGVLSGKREQAAEDQAVAGDAQDRVDEAKTYATVANVSFAAGGSLVLTGLIWGYLDWTGTREAERASSDHPRLVVSHDRISLALSF